jgi:hypothetical protein
MKAKDLSPGSWKCRLRSQICSRPRLANLRGTAAPAPARERYQGSIHKRQSTFKETIMINFVEHNPVNIFRL